MEDEEKKLEKQLTTLREIQGPLQDRLNEIKSVKQKAWTHGLIGKCYVYRNNSYGSETEKWDEFYKVVGPDDWGVMAINCSIDCYGKASIENTNMSVHGINRRPNDYDEISNAEFMKNFQKALAKLTKEAAQQPASIKEK